MILNFANIFFRKRLKSVRISYYDTECMQFWEKMMIFSHIFNIHLKNTM